MTTYAADQREQVQIIGTVAGATQKSPENFQIQVVPDGSQNSKNLWTKDRDCVAWNMSQVGNRVAFLCNVSHWERQGQQVTSLWIEQYGPPTVDSPALAGPTLPVAPPPQPPPQPAAPARQGWQQPQPQGIPVTPTVIPGVQPDPTEKKIHRQTASKVAAILLGYLPESERTMATLLVLSERLVAYYDNGLPQAETLDQLMARAMPQGMDAAAGGEGYANTPPPPGDDDIPF